jgi:ATP-dependent Clp protease ATP-binding subunit ClpX
MNINGNEIKLVTPKEIKEKLDETIIGQEDAKITLSVAIYNHFKRITSADSGIVAYKKNNILMAGPTGCGKTELVRTIGRILNVPVYIADATSLTQAGYVGDDVETILAGLIRVCGKNPELAQYGIVCIDEIDKLAIRGKNPNITRDVGGEGVQQALLKVLEGSVVGVPLNSQRKHPEAQLAYIDTTNILFIGLGAFTNLGDIVKKRNGFNERPVISIEHTNHDPLIEGDDNTLNCNPYCEYTHEDLVKFGFIPEFAGRFQTLTYVNELTLDDYIRIMKEPSDSIIKQYTNMFALDGVKFTITDDAIKSIAERAIDMGLGARGLKTVTEDVLLEFMYKLPGTDRKRLKIDKNTVIRRLCNKYKFKK